jgi:hypothetical protein
LYIYWNSAEFRTKEFNQRLARKVKLLPQVLDDVKVAAALATLPEQTGYIYGPDNQLLYAAFSHRMIFWRRRGTTSSNLSLRAPTTVTPSAA